MLESDLRFESLRAKKKKKMIKSNKIASITAIQLYLILIMGDLSIM